MPSLVKRFSHRLYDVRAIQLFCESMGMPPIPKANAHRVLADIKESMQIGQKCQAWLATSSSKLLKGVLLGSPSNGCGDLMGDLQNELWNDGQD